jgi:hypothetical protein
MEAATEKQSGVSYGGKSVPWQSARSKKRGKLVRSGAYLPRFVERQHERTERKTVARERLNLKARRILAYKREIKRLARRKASSSGSRRNDYGLIVFMRANEKHYLVGKTAHPVTIKKAVNIISKLFIALKGVIIRRCFHTVLSEIVKALTIFNIIAHSPLKINMYCKIPKQIMQKKHAEACFFAIKMV